MGSHLGFRFQVVVAQTAESVGYEGVQQSAADTLADLLLQYISEIGGATHGYAELAGRVDCNVNDLVHPPPPQPQSLAFSTPDSRSASLS